MEVRNRCKPEPVAADEPGSGVFAASAAAHGAC